MKRRLLTDDQYRELAELKSVPQAVTYLKQQPAYEAILDSLSEEALHLSLIHISCIFTPARTSNPAAYSLIVSLTPGF